MRVERPVKENISSKPAVTQVPQKPADGEPTAKQNSLPAPVQQSEHMRHFWLQRVAVACPSLNKQQFGDSSLNTHHIDMLRSPLVLCFHRKTRGEPSAQTSKEEEGEERDMRSSPLCRSLYAKDFISCLCNTFCDKNFELRSSWWTYKTLKKTKKNKQNLSGKWKRLLYTSRVSRWIVKNWT